MSTAVEKTYTPEELLAMPNRKAYELVDGHLVERHMSRLSTWVGGRLYRFLDTFDELSGDNVVPGFRYRVADLFPQKTVQSRSAG